MTEQLEQDLRALSFTEPPLGFDTEAVATKAAARQRKRLVAASGLGTLAVIGAIVATTVVPSAVVQPAAGPKVTASVPPVGMPMSLIRDHLPALLKAVRPEAKDIVETTQGYPFVSLEFRYDLNGHPARISGHIGGPAVVPGSGAVPRTCLADCTSLPQPDGSEVQIRQTNRFEDSRTGDVKPAVIEAWRYWPNGAEMEIRTGFLTRGSEGVPLTYEQVTRLITDPAFTLK
ncbi:hypothetical protein AB5J62_31880 [Amycolatopsis sp. cg5]|uniref:hypothetical protein n=1 Tax=Amycolatopsis sp. cg5 TaxID=3238802 RepID=UPI0035265FBD